MVEISLADRPAIVTGASRGIGRAIAERFAAAGSDVVICSRSLDRVKPVADDITDNYQAQAVPVACNITETEQVQEMVDTAIERFGAIKVLVNNAGGADESATLLHRTEEETFQQMVQLNLVSQYRVTKEVLPIMVAGGGGSIVHIGSVNGLFGIGLAGYSGAKSGLLALSRNIATHYGQYGVRSNVISAGTIETESRREEMRDTDNRAGSDARETWIDQYPLGRFGTPSEVADAAVFLASERAGFITGTDLTVDGGLTCGLSTSFVNQIYQADDRPPRR
jgi:3-oxoacyl-[acyl-carrier protein] reductase